MSALARLIDPRDQFVQLLSEWFDDPELFARDALGIELETWQANALREIAAGKCRIAIRSGHGTGKSTLLAVCILWFGLTRHNARIPATAPVADQLDKILWPEVRKWKAVLERRFPWIGAQVDVKGDTIVFGNGTFAAARTARPEKPEALQGFHADHLLFILEEASGIDEKIFEVGEGALSTRGAIVLMAGNPTRASGYFFNAFHRNRADWATFKVSCFDSTRVDPAYPERMAREYGIASNVYRVRVLGEFPKSDDDAVIPLELIDAAIGRKVSTNPSRRPIWGLDVARFGADANCLIKRRANVVTEPAQVWRNTDLMQTCGRVVREWQDTPFEDRPVVVCVDVIGLGAGVADRLLELGIPVLAVNVAESPSVDDGRFMRMRDELWFEARDWFSDRACSLVDDPDLAGELCSVKYKTTSGGKLLVESKDEMKKRGLQSPNRADAFVLTFAHEGVQDSPVRSFMPEQVESF